MTRAVVAKRRRRAERERMHPLVYFAPAGTSPLESGWRRIGRLVGWSGRSA